MFILPKSNPQLSNLHILQIYTACIYGLKPRIIMYYFIFIHMDCIGYIPTTPIWLVDLRFDLFCCTSCRWHYSHLMPKNYYSSSNR